MAKSANNDASSTTRLNTVFSDRIEPDFCFITRKEVFWLLLTLFPEKQDKINNFVDRISRRLLGSGGGGTESEFVAAEEFVQPTNTGTEIFTSRAFLGNFLGLESDEMTRHTDVVRASDEPSHKLNHS